MADTIVKARFDDPLDTQLPEEFTTCETGIVLAHPLAIEDTEYVPELRLNVATPLPLVTADADPVTVTVAPMMGFQLTESVTGTVTACEPTPDTVAGYGVV